jgi:hypothetical protein
MEPLLRYRTMEAFRRQRVKIDGEDESFWLTEAELLAKLATNYHRMNVLGMTSLQNHYFAPRKKPTS